MTLRALLSLGLLCCFSLSTVALRAADKWELQYEHLDKEYDLRLLDIAFVDATHGVASGFIDSRERERQRPVNLVTTDGKTWTLVETKKLCQDLHALKSGVIFAACEDGIYRSVELGRDWNRVARLKDIESIWFLNERVGFAVGTSRGFYSTQDGGQRWAPVTPTPELTTTKDYTVLRHIHFVNDKVGFIAGWSRPPKGREELPDWMTPDRAMRQRDTPHVNVFLDTSDGGLTWKSQEVSMFGEIVSAMLGPDHTGLTLLNFSNAFEFPAEVFYFNWPKGMMKRTFRETNRAVTDIALPAEGPAYLAAVEPMGQLFWSPIPGKLRILRSVDFMKWEEMDVDYRASARRARLQALDAANVWAITDTGMILKLRQDGPVLTRKPLPPDVDPPAHIAKPESKPNAPAAKPSPAKPDSAKPWAPKQ